MSYDEGVFIEPLACVVRGLRMSGLQPGQSVLVLGSGIAGLLNIKLARALGAGRIMATDVSEYRLDAARGSARTMCSRRRTTVPMLAKEANGGAGVDLVIVCTGASQAFGQAFKSLGRGSTLLMFAPPGPGVEVAVPFADLWKDEVTILTTYAGSPKDIEQAIELIRSRRLTVTDMITHRFGLADTQKGFEAVAKAQDSIKVVIEPQR